MKNLIVYFRRRNVYELFIRNKEFVLCRRGWEEKSIRIIDSLKISLDHINPGLRLKNLRLDCSRLIVVLSFLNFRLGILLQKLVYFFIYSELICWYINRSKLQHYWTLEKDTWESPCVRNIYKLEFC